MGRKLRAMVLAAPVLAATLVSAQAASADSGDGKLGCNWGEICFNRDGGNLTYQKHFWNSGSHDNYKFTNVSTGTTGHGNVRDNAYSVKNRDGSCTVKVVDDRGFYPDDVHAIPNNSTWVMLKDAVRDQNDRHERC